MKKIGRIFAILAAVLMAFAFCLQGITFVMSLTVGLHEDLWNILNHQIYADGFCAFYVLLELFCTVCLIFLTGRKKGSPWMECVLFSVLLVITLLSRESISNGSGYAIPTSEEWIIVLLSLRSICALLYINVIFIAEMLACTACGLSFARIILCREDKQEEPLPEEPEELPLQELLEEQEETVAPPVEESKPIRVKVVKKTKV